MTILNDRRRVFWGSLLALFGVGACARAVLSRDSDDVLAIVLGVASWAVVALVLTIGTNPVQERPHAFWGWLLVFVGVVAGACALLDSGDFELAAIVLRIASWVMIGILLWIVGRWALRRASAVRR